MAVADSPSTRRPSASRPAAVVAVLAFALLVRGGALWSMPGALSTDPDGYRFLARSLVEHGRYAYGDVPTAYRPPLYPLMLAVCEAMGEYANVAVAMLHLAVGVATVGLAERLGRRWGLGRGALAGAVLVACDPILVVQSTLVMTETPAALLAVASLLALTSASQSPSPGRAALAGAWLALAALCRATFLPLLVFAAVLLPFFAGTWRRGLVPGGCLVAAAVAVLAPWAVRNARHFGRPLVSTTHGGYTLLLANNPSFYEYLRHGAWGSVWDADAFNAAWRRRATRSEPADELHNQRLAYREAWAAMRNDPRTFAYSCLVRAGRFWGLMPHQLDAGEGPARRWGRRVVGVWYLAETALAALGLVVVLKRGLGQDDRSRPDATGRAGSSRPWTGWLWGLLFAATLTGIHAIFWSNMRMRAPLVPVVALAAVAGAAAIVARTAGRDRLVLLHSSSAGTV